MNSCMQTYTETLAQDRRRLELAKPLIITALNSLSVVHVLIEYDGEGDNGQIHSIAAYAANDHAVDLEQPYPVSIDEGDRQCSYDTLAEAIDAVAWDLLRQYHDGFENNEGGCGTITISVPDAKITMDHNDRFVELFNTQTEF